jgi:hypothetical protein
MQTILLRRERRRRAHCEKGGGVSEERMGQEKSGKREAVESEIRS